MSISDLRTRWSRSLAATWLWLKWTVARNSISPRGQRDGLERASRWVSLLVPILLALVLLPAVGVVSVLAFFGGLRLFDGGEAPAVVGMVARVLLGLLTIAMLIAPAVRSGRGSDLDVRRWLFLPISRSALHRREVLGALTDPWLLAMSPALLLLPLGMLFAGHPGEALLVLLGSLALVACLTLLGTTIASLVALLFRKRRRGELVSLVLILVLSVSGFLPQFFAGRDLASGDEAAQAEVEAEIKQSLDSLDIFPAWAQLFPSEIYARAAMVTGTGKLGEAGLGVVALVLMAGLLYRASLRSFDRLLQVPETSGRSAASDTARHGTLRVPLMAPQTSALAVAWTRSYLRTLRGKMAWIVPPLFLVLMNLLWGGLLDRVPAAFSIARGPVLAQAGALLALLSLQPMMFNQFAIDGAGLSALFMQPVSSRRAIRAKQVAMALLAAPPVAIVLLVGAILGRGGTALGWLAVTINLAIVFFAAGALGSALSIVLPRKVDLNAMGSDANAHTAAGLIGTFATFLLFTPGALATVQWPGIAPWIPTAILAVCLGLVVAAGRSLENLAARLLKARQENLLQVVRQ